jgi:gliding motility-associated-like protein
MDNLESIDKYLVSEIDEMETLPSDQVWNSIDTKLASAKAARKIRSRNWKIAGVSALAIATVALVTYTMLPENKSTENKIVITPVATPIQNSPASTSENQPTETIKATKDKAVSTKQNTLIKNTELAGKTIEKAEEPKNINSVSLNEKQELPVKNTTVSSVATESKKDNSDKSIIMLPYFAPNYAGTTNTQNDRASIPPPSVNSKIEPVSETTTTKAEPKETTIYMPNAFTPNGDGLNDIFLPQTAEAPTEYKLSVFDRSGNLVFISDDIQKGWDGRINKNGLEEVKEDVYIWRIEMKTAKGEKRHLMGSVTLLK